ncbi:hypothetical protein [Streptomyces celluloflavus]|uniref:Uncharacterized protein n=1 Tax=Streptomyces celluloflavus TaxID=58344 RepID=A0ABW7REN1_9ACTN|nr:hypothetical protein OG717_32540 [Streptomyces celluloflavus]
MTSNITVHADTVLIDIDHLARLSTGERTALAAFLTGRTWGALTDRGRGFAGAEARCAEAGLPEPALILTGTTSPATYTAAAEMLGTEVGACAVVTPDPDAADAALTAGAISLLLDPDGRTPARPCGVLSLPALTGLVPSPASPWSAAFAV